MSMSGSVANWQIRKSKKKKKKKKKKEDEVGRIQAYTAFVLFYKKKSYFYACCTFGIDTFHGIMHSKYSHEHEHDASVAA